MSESIQMRVQKVLQGPHPREGLVAELLTSYAAKPFIPTDPDFVYLLKMCADETEALIRKRPSDERDAARECAAIFRAMVDEATGQEGTQD